MLICSYTRNAYIGVYKFNLAEKMFLIGLKTQIDAGRVTFVSPRVFHLLVDFLMAGQHVPSPPGSFPGQHVSSPPGSSSEANLAALEQCILKLRVNTEDTEYLIGLV